MDYCPTQFEKKWQKSFSETAQAGGEDYKISRWTKEGLDSYIKYFFEYFRPNIKTDNSQTLLLDAGCGPGTFSRLLAKKGFRVSAVDCTHEMIVVAKEKSPGLNIDYQAANINSLPYADNFFDIIICLGVFQSNEGIVRTIEEMRRTLKRGGVLIITTLNHYSFSCLLKITKDYSSERRSPYECRKILQKSGFYNIKLKGNYFFPKFLDFLTRAIFKFKIFKILNPCFPLFMFISNSFYIEGRKK